MARNKCGRSLTLHGKLHGVASVVTLLVGGRAGVVAGVLSPKITHSQNQVAHHYARVHVMDHLCSLRQVRRQWDSL